MPVGNPAITYAQTAQRCHPQDTSRDNIVFGKGNVWLYGNTYFIVTKTPD